MLKIGDDLPDSLERDLIKCLKANARLSVVSPYEMPCINPTVTYHQLNIDPSV